MLRKLDIKNEDDVKSFSRVMVHVFKDGVTNWGRIVTLISFGAYVAKHLKSINQENCIEPLAESITDVLVRSKRDWLVKQRGWVSLLYSLKEPWIGNGVQDFVKAEAAKGFCKAPGSRSNLCTSGCLMLDVVSGGVQRKSGMTVLNCTRRSCILWVLLVSWVIFRAVDLKP